MFRGYVWIRCSRRSTGDAMAARRPPRLVQCAPKTPPQAKGGLPQFQISPAELSESPDVASKDTVRRAAALPTRDVAGSQFGG